MPPRHSRPRSRPRSPSAPFTPARLQEDWRVLCEEIGERRAGTEAEGRAAAYIAQQFRAAGAAEVEVQPFPCVSLRGAACRVEAPAGRGWRAVESAPLVGAPGTPRGQAVVGPLVWLEFPEGAGRLRPGSLRGAIAGLFGPLPTSLAQHQALVAAAPAAVVHVDERLPFTWTKNDGVYPYWAGNYGMPATVTVPYQTAWRWRVDGVPRLRVRVAPQVVAAESQNVVATFPGRVPGLPAIALSAHHDTQCHNVGADDNASGVVALLALSRRWRGRRFRRTVQLLSFGAEEQLSVGSAAYVRAARPTPREVGLLVNFDSVASPLGHFEMWSVGSPGLPRFAAAELARDGVDVQVRAELSPFFDSFPFNRAGIPSLGFMRPNFPGGRWQHHSAHDSLANVSTGTVRRLLEAVAPMVERLADRPRWPFATGLPAAQQSVARRLGRELFGR